MAEHLRSLSGSSVLSFEFLNDLCELRRLPQIVESFSAEHTFSDSLRSDLYLVLEELLINIISYAYDDEKKHKIQMHMTVEKNVMIVQLIDNGQPFNPLLVSAAKPSKKLSEQIIGGLGIHLVKNLMDESFYERKDHLNIFTLEKKIDSY